MSLRIERDDRFPIRVTVQFYKATSNGKVSAKDMEDISRQIKKVYDNADYVGSLVVDGFSQRPTEHSGPKWEPPDWWDNFWRQYEADQGISRDEAMRRLRHLLGPTWNPRSRDELQRKLDDANKRRK